MSAIPSISIGDASGFAALILIGATATLMLFRSKLLRLTKNLAAIRAIHVAVSTLAGSFLVVHLACLFSLPSSLGVLLGYFATGAALVVWVSGTAFLERLRDSLFFHGTLASSLVALALVHAATAGANIPYDLSEVMLGSTAVLMAANAAFPPAQGFSDI